MHTEDAPDPADPARFAVPVAAMRWRCPLAWVRRRRDPSELPPRLWGQDRVHQELSTLAQLARPEAPKQLLLAAPAGVSYAFDVAEALRGFVCDDRPVLLLDRPTTARLRGRRGSGLLHRADGGFVVVDTQSLRDDDGAWSALREAITLGTIERLKPKEDDGDTEPPERLDDALISVVLVGPDLALKPIAAQDPRLSHLFARRVPFRVDVPRDRDGVACVVARLRRFIDEAELGDVSLGALAYLMEEASGHGVRRGRLSLQTLPFEEALAEARLKKPQGRLRADVLRQTLAQRAQRTRLSEEQHRERMDRGQLLVRCEGALVGVVNGLMVYGGGPTAYSIPGRITARVAVGREGLINIEREAKYSGRSFDKGIYLLTGFLRSLFARKSPLGLVASLAFEQSHGKVDGDSATLAEALAIFSELSDLPCRQDVAVTGALNQRGELMPVGSINLKVDGWYQSCKQRGLTGSQGVLFPAASAADLQLDAELIDAVERGRFHLYAAATVDDAVEVLLGRVFGRVEPGEPFVPGSVYHLSAGRMRAMSERLYPPRGGAPKKKAQPKKGGATPPRNG